MIPIFTIDVMNKMTPDELEVLCDISLPERQRIIDSVTAALNIPDGWHIIGECQCEFGGLFPVQWRMTTGLMVRKLNRFLSCLLTIHSSMNHSFYDATLREFMYKMPALSYF